MKKVTAFQSLNGKLFGTEREALIEDRRAKLEEFVTRFGYRTDCSDSYVINARLMIEYMDELAAILTQ